MNIVICDDEALCRRQVEECVTAWAKAHGRESAVSVHTYPSSEDLLEHWEGGLPIDMLLLDIEIPSELSGMEVAKRIHEKNEYVPMAFITNYAEYALDGYTVNALRYLLKPVTPAAISECLDIAWSRWMLAQSDSVSIQAGRQTLLVPARNIILIEAQGHTLRIETAGGEPIETRAKLGDYLSMLPKGMFGQCHKGFIVNVQYVRRIEPGKITLAGGKPVPVGRKYAGQFFDLFNRYNQGR